MEFKSVIFNAARDGQLYSLKVFLDQQKPEVAAKLLSEETDGGTPLAIACMNGHLEVVKYLINNYKVNVEQTAYVAIGLYTEAIRLTPLMIAAFNGYFEICQVLIQNRADINSKTNLGNTALQYSALSGNLDIVKLLLKNGAEYNKDSEILTPLVSAAANGHTAIVEYFIQDSEHSKQDKIDALEVLGATFMDKKYDIMALDCWRRAMHLRYEDIARPVEKPTIQSPIASCLDATEVRTFSQLEELASNPDTMSLKIQTLLIADRILHSEHRDTMWRIMEMGMIYKENHNFNPCIQLWLYQLDTQQKFIPVTKLTKYMFHLFIELFSYMMSETVAIKFQDILKVFQSAVKEIKRAWELSQKLLTNLPKRNYTNWAESPEFHEILIISVHLIGLMCQLELNKKEVLELKQSVHYFIKLEAKSKGGLTPLHVACMQNNLLHGIVYSPSLEVIDLLLEVGACPNDVDSDKNTPLHIAAVNEPCDLFKSLLNHGAHLDICNSENQTPLQLAQQTLLLDIYPLRHINLQCLCAQVVQSNKIPYKGFVHKRLEEFIDVH